MKGRRREGGKERETETQKQKGIEKEGEERAEKCRNEGVRRQGEKEGGRGWG